MLSVSCVAACGGLLLVLFWPCACLDRTLAQHHLLYTGLRSSCRLCDEPCLPWGRTTVRHGAVPTCGAPCGEMKPHLESEGSTACLAATYGYSNIRTLSESDGNDLISYGRQNVGHTCHHASVGRLRVPSALNHGPEQPESCQHGPSGA